MDKGVLKLLSNRSGDDFATQDGSTLVDSTVLELTEEQQTFTFENIPEVSSLGAC